MAYHAPRTVLCTEETSVTHVAMVFEATAELQGDKHVPLKYNMMESPLLAI